MKIIINIFIISVSFFVMTSRANTINNLEVNAVNDSDVVTSIDPLSLSVRMIWHENIKNVGQAVQYILEPSGYRVTLSPRDSEKIANKKLPAIAKVKRTIPIIDVIQILIVLDNTIIVDHKHKLVSFQKRSEK